MASLQDIQKAFGTKQGLTLDKEYQGSKNVGFVGDTANIGGANFSSAQDLYNAVYGGGQSVQSGSYAQPNFESTLQRAMQLQKEAAQPAISSLQASIPEIQKSYASQTQYAKGQVSNLESRYKTLLDSIKTNQAGAETGAIKTTSQELGRRGIVGSSGVADVAMQEAVNPIKAQYSNLLSQTGVSQEADIAAANQAIANLGLAETEATRNVNNAIAQLQSATTTAGINQALQQLQIAQTDLQNERQASQFQQQQDQANKIYETISLPESQAQIAASKKAAAGSGGMSVSDLLSLFGGGASAATTSTGFSNVDSLIAQGKYEEARQLLLNP
jgi:hypothetical protein